MQIEPTTEPSSDSPEQDGGGEAATDDDAVRTLVRRLSRPHPSGGTVIERAAIMAEGGDSSAVLAWIADHEGEAEALTPKGSGGGLHGGRVGGGSADQRKPLRFVLPPGALS